MKLYLGYTSALDYWRQNDLDSHAQIIRSDAASFAAPNRHVIEKAQTELSITHPPFHVVVSSPAKRRAMTNIICHATGSTIPKSSFINHSPHVAISSPEACFLQLANIIPFIDLIQVGFELCGTYALDPKSGTLLVREKRTSTQLLAKYLQKATKAHGLVKARRALPFICDNSASPMETKLTLLLCLPTLYGGYGLPKPLLNKPLEVDEGWRTKTYRCDLTWLLSKTDKGKQHRLALEYDSSAFHSGLEKMHLDSKRRVAIESENIHVLSITKQQVYDDRAFDHLAKVVAKYLGVRLRSDRKDFFARQQKLRKDMQMLC